MKLSHDLSSHTFLVAGLGKSGMGSIALLRRQGAKVLATDDRPHDSTADFTFLSASQAQSANYDALIASPGVPLTHPAIAAARARQIPVLGEVELAYQYLEGPVAATTGSNGKTTTTTLVGEMLKAGGIPAQVGGNIGFAVTDMTLSSRALQWNVLELSSFQLESIHTFHPQIAAVLNVTPNHLDRHETLENYRAAKGRIFENQKASDWAVLNQGDNGSRSYSPGLASRVAWFQGEAAQRIGGRLELFGSPLMPVSDVLLPGSHNLENVMAAAVVASLAGASHQAIANVAATFKGVPHRLEFIREWRGVKFVNDSKATSVDATLKAIAALPAPLFVILGGKGKGASYAPLIPLLQEKAKQVLVIGEDTPNIVKDLAAALQLAELGDLATAIEYAAQSAAPGDTVLLAPACASYDQFTSYEHRGNTFRALVEALEG
jgi:UDP-N-acetylmuramoylalanine--D-glutamate ligase